MSFKVRDHVVIKVDPTSQPGRQKSVGENAGNHGIITNMAAGWITVNGKKFRKTELMLSGSPRSPSPLRTSPPRTSPPRTSPRTSPFRSKDRIVTVTNERSKTNAGTLGKEGIIKEVKGKNNMYKVTIEGKTYNFYAGDLTFAPGEITPKKEKRRSSPKTRVSPKGGFSPDTLEAQLIADELVSKIRSSIKDKVLKIMCKGRTTTGAERVARTSAGAKKKKSPKPCGPGYERLASGRCARECAPDQRRNDKNRCVKISGKKVSPKKKSEEFFEEPIRVSPRRTPRTSPKRTPKWRVSPEEYSPDSTISSYRNPREEEFFEEEEEPENVWGSFKSKSRTPSPKEEVNDEDLFG